MLAIFSPTPVSKQLSNLL